MWPITKKKIRQMDLLSDLYISPPALSNLIKFKQTSLLVFTGIIAYLISSWQTNTPVLYFLIFIVGIFFAVSGSTLLNMYFDRDIDALMGRTMFRPLPTGTIKESTVLIYGILMSIAGILIVSFDNILTAVVVFLGVVIDSFIYSVLLKRRTKYSILFGGIAGGLPAIAGRVAFTNNLDLVAILLGLLIIAWVPIHILTLALIPKNLEGYKNAHIPMWPVVSSTEETCRIIALSAIASTLSYLLCVVFLGDNLLICLPIIVFGICLIGISFVNLIRPKPDLAFKTFKMASIFLFGAFFSLFFGIL